MSFRVLYIVLFFVFSCSIQQAYAQSSELLQKDLSNVTSGQITDRQLKQLADYAEKQGLTEAQIETGLITRNMPAAEASKVVARLRSVSSSSSSSGKQSQSNSNTDTSSSIESNLSEKDTVATKLSKEEKKVFGSQLFSSEDLTFEPSYDVATPENYQVGPGDELRINIWGASRQTYNLEVSRDGNVIIDNLGPIYVNGLSIDQASTRIINRLTEIYSGLKRSGERPANTFAEVTLGRVRSIKVTIVGEVQKPGTYTLPSVATAFNALYLCGGPTFIGSFRNVEVIRNSEVVANIDVYGYLVRGVKTQNIVLKDQDVIRVIPYDNRIEMKGEVKRPGYYEIKGKEHLGEAIRFSGGFTDKAYTHRLKVTRKTSREKRIENVSEEEIADFLPKNGDVVYVDSILDRYTNRVELVGAVFRPGEYALSEDTPTTVVGLIKQAEGLREDAYKQRVLITRKDEFLFDQVISANLIEIASGKAQDIELKREDVVRVLSIKDLEEDFMVSINGEVQEPGKFPFMYDMTIQDLIVMSGGLKESAANAKIEVSRRIKASISDSLLETETKETAQIYQFKIGKQATLDPAANTFVLQPFDQVFIRRSPNYQEQRTIYVKGEVKYPGEYAIKNKDERISDIVDRAGGLTSYAYPDGASLIRLNPAYFKEKIEKEGMLKDSLRAVLYQEQFAKSIEEGAPRKMTNSIKKDDSFSDDEHLAVIEPKEEDSYIARAVVPSYEIEAPVTQGIGIELDNILTKPGSKYDIRLLAGDTLVIPKKLETVTMSGSLLYPVASRFDKRKTFRNYISEAGGFTKDADKRRAYIVYANGSVDRTRSFIFVKDYPKVKPGAQIVVPEKKERNSLSPQAWLGISTGLGTLTLTLLRILDRF